MKVYSGDKRSSLLHDGTDYDGQKFYGLDRLVKENKLWRQKQKMKRRVEENF
jgi:hypothetical protein